MKLDISMALMSFGQLVTPREVKRDEVEDERDGFYMRFELSRTDPNLNLFEIFRSDLMFRLKSNGCFSQYELFKIQIQNCSALVLDFFRFFFDILNYLNPKVALGLN